MYWERFYCADWQRVSDTAKKSGAAHINYTTFRLERRDDTVTC